MLTEFSYFVYLLQCFTKKTLSFFCSLLKLPWKTKFTEIHINMYALFVQLLVFLLVVMSIYICIYKAFGINSVVQ